MDSDSERSSGNSSEEEEIPVKRGKAALSSSSSSSRATRSSAPSSKSAKSAESSPKRYVFLHSAPLDGLMNIVQIPHPKTNEPTLFAMTDSRLLELQRAKRSSDRGSWFIGDSVSKDGTLYMSTEFDPLFFILPALQFNKKLTDSSFPSMYSPLSQHFMDVPEHISKIYQAYESQIDMSCIGESKDIGGGDMVYRLSKDQVLKWLRVKVDRISRALAASSSSSSSQSIPSSSSGEGTFKLTAAQRKEEAASAALAAASSSSSSPSESAEETKNRQSIRMAIGILSEYIRDDALELLARFYEPAAYQTLLDDISGIKPAASAASVQESDGNFCDAPPSSSSSNSVFSPNDGKRKNAGADAGAASKKAKAAPPPKASKINTTGMKSLSSFFGKK